MSEEVEIWRAEFDDKVCTYWLLSGIVLLTVIVVGIPFLIFWIPLGLFFTKRYLARMECVLTDKALKVKKGLLVRVEKTIPLEKITDMGMVQGPIMRSFELHTLTVETAGQSGQGALVSLTGIIDSIGFREAVLNQREFVTASSPKPTTETTPGDLVGTDSVLVEMRDILLRIESRMEKLVGRKTD